VKFQKFHCVVNNGYAMITTRFKG